MRSLLDSQNVVQLRSECAFAEAFLLDTFWRETVDVETRTTVFSRWCCGDKTSTSLPVCCQALEANSPLCTFLNSHLISYVAYSLYFILCVCFCWLSPWWLWTKKTVAYGLPQSAFKCSLTYIYWYVLHIHCNPCYLSFVQALFAYLLLGYNPLIILRTVTHSAQDLRHCGMYTKLQHAQSSSGWSYSLA